MKKSAWNKTISMIKAHGGYIRSKDLRTAGVHPTVLPAMAREGAAIRLKRGLYTLPDYKKRDELTEALLSVPGSVLCLGSALSFHELGTWEPPEIYLAVKSGRKIRLPDFPPIRLFHFSAGSFGLGLIENAGRNKAVRVYDAERTVCDLFRFRHRLGRDISAEALREYMRRRSRNVNKLLSYAEKLHILGPIRRSLEILL